MKKYDYLNYSKILVIAFVIFISCDGTWVQDPIDARLPKYTELGNNVAGALINDKVWESIAKVDFSDAYYPISNVPFILVQGSDSLLIGFSGNTNGKNAKIQFYLTGLNISKFQDLLTLGGHKIQLDGISNAGYYFEKYPPMDYSNKGVGQIYFRNIENDQSALIFSGTFGFTINHSSGKTTNVSYGRFDFRIGKSNFYTE
jgi:hypothetical protein